MANIEHIKLEITDYISKNPDFSYKTLSEHLGIDPQYVRKLCSVMVKQKLLPEGCLKFRKEHLIRQAFLEKMNGDWFTIKDFEDYSGKGMKGCYVHLTNLVKRGQLTCTKHERKNIYCERNK
jgi:hypothetical protein